jgi:osmotically-inducible protein OsmY
MPFHCTDYPDPHASSQGPSSHQLPPSDAELRHQIQARILADPWVHGDRVQVVVNQGVVTLTGTIDSLEAKRAADDDAWDTPGVREVHNDLVVVSSV